VGERQEQRDVEIKSDCRRREPFELEMIMVQQVVESTAVLDGKYHGPFLVHLFQAVPRAFIQLGALEKPEEQPAQQESRFVIQHVGVIDFFVEIIQELRLRMDWWNIDNEIAPSNQAFCFVTLFSSARTK
jgi:hypothetical protein